MIHALTGSIAHISEQYVVVDCEPFSFSMQIPINQPLVLGQKLKIHTYLHWNQENGPSLFGFLNEIDRTVFLLIISCSGLGPKIALALITDLGAHGFLKAVHAADENALTNVSGIGAKKAEQIIVQLKHKVAKLIDSGVSLSSDASLEQWQTVSQVLQSLNYSRHEISAALKYIGDQSQEKQLSFDQVMRQALSFLAKKA